MSKLWTKACDIKPVWVDGILYVCIALLGAMEATFTSDEAYKYFNPYFLYFSKELTIWILASVTALKMFRSRSYGDHLDAKAQEQALAEGNKQSTVKQIKTNETTQTVTPAVVSTTQ